MEKSACVCARAPALVPQVSSSASYTGDVAPLQELFLPVFFSCAGGETGSSANRLLAEDPADSDAAASTSFHLTSPFIPLSPRSSLLHTFLASRLALLPRCLCYLVRPEIASLQARLLGISTFSQQASVAAFVACFFFGSHEAKASALWLPTSVSPI